MKDYFLKTDLRFLIIVAGITIAFLLGLKIIEGPVQYMEDILFDIIN
jgi:hypothetical protein